MNALDRRAAQAACRHLNVTENYVNQYGARFGLCNTCGIGVSIPDPRAEPSPSQMPLAFSESET